MNSHITCKNYELLTTGSGFRLERFGELILKRPARLAIWEPNKKILHDNLPVVEFDHKKGWFSENRKLDDWLINLDIKTKDGENLKQISLKLRFQNNGQIGFFPEHLSYLDLIADYILKKKNNSCSNPKLLNLYAFTGMASMVSAYYGADVTHVDILQTANNWAKENYEINSTLLTPIRFITEDAIKYCTRAINRSEKYDLIITDPPSFSRTGKNTSWNLEENLVEQVKLCKELLNETGMLIFTSHLHEFGNLVLENICREVFGNFGNQADVQSEQLFIKERDREMKLPAGFGTRASLPVDTTIADKICKKVVTLS